MMTNKLSFLSIAALCILITAGVSAQQREWTIVASYTIPGKASGLTWDGTYLYSGLYSAPGDDNLVYRIDPSDGSYSLQCVGPFGQAYGMSFDGTNLWTTDHIAGSNPGSAIEFDYSGNLVSSFILPGTYYSGIEYDNGDFWVCCYYDPDGMIYKLDNQGNIITQFASPELQPWAICKENDYLWIADYNANMLYRVDQTGTVIESHPSEGIKPAGIAFDGTYLWYFDGQLQSPSTLYKVDMGGAGTPQINVPVASHDYGIVNVGSSETWDMVVENTGTGNLTISGLQIPNAVPVFTTFTPPVTIIPGNFITIPLTYAPTEQGALSTTIQILSNDPINPSEPVILLGNAVIPGPAMYLMETSHGYGQVRVNAFTRWFLELTNVGSEDLVIDEILYNTEFFTLDGGTVLPLVVQPLDTVRIGTWFNPRDDVNYSDIMQVHSNDPLMDPAQIYLVGSGIDKEYPMGDMLWYYILDADPYDNSPKSIVPIYDITDDKVDDVIVGSEDDFIRCFNGNSHNIADVLWEFEIYAGSVYQQESIVTIEDLDDDGFMDVIAGTAWGDRSVHAISGKTGQQIWEYDTHEYGEGGWVYEVATGIDYSGDGIDDVLAATGNDAGDQGPKRIFCLEGSDGSVIWSCATGGPNFSVIAVEDFTGDGQPDAVAGSSTNDETQGKVYGINGANGTIYWVFNNVIGSSVWAVKQLGDINGDGIRDIAAGDFSGRIYYLDGSNGVQLAGSYLGNEIILHFNEVDDIDQDGYTDLAVAYSGNDAIVISGLDATNIWLTSLADKAWNLAGANDLNQDGTNDVMIGTLPSQNYCYFLNGENGEEMHSIYFGTPVDAMSAIPDIVGDGSMEMVAGGRDGSLYCYSGQGEAPVGIGPAPAGPVRSASSVYPNPFSNETRISFILEEENDVSVNVYTAGGKLARTLFEGRLGPGDHGFTWDGRSADGSQLPNGVYIYAVLTSKGRSSGRMMLTR